MILTSKRRAKHPFAGRNTQQRNEPQLQKVFSKNQDKKNQDCQDRF